MEHSKVSSSEHTSQASIGLSDDASASTSVAFKSSPLQSPTTQRASEDGSLRSARRARLKGYSPGTPAQMKQSKPVIGPAQSPVEDVVKPWNSTPNRYERRSALRNGGVQGQAVAQRKENNQEESSESVKLPTGGGTALPAPVQAKMEQSFSTDFSDVRLHQGDYVNKMGANAVTQGSNVHFAPGQLNTSTQSGQALLGHELTHVVQQREGRVQADSQVAGLATNTNAGLESEADRKGAMAAASDLAPSTASQSPVTPPSTEGTVQRKAVQQGNVAQFDKGKKGKKKEDKEETARKPFHPKTTTKKELEAAYGSPKKAKAKGITPKGKGTQPNAKKEDNNKIVLPGPEKEDPKKEDPAEIKKREDEEKRVKDELEKRRLEEEEQERQRLETEVSDGVFGLDTLVINTEKDLGINGLQSSILQPIVVESVFPVIAKALFTKEQAETSKAIKKERGAELEQAYKEQMEAIAKQSEEGAKEGGATGEWKKLKAEKAMLGKPGEGKAKALSDEIARQSVEAQLIEKAPELTQKAWEALGDKTWLNLVTESMGKNSFLDMHKQVSELSPEKTDMAALKAAKARISNKTATIHDALSQVRGKTREAFEATATNKKNLEKIQDKIRSGLNLSWRKSGSKEDREKINKRAKDNAGKKDVQMTVAAGKASADLESSLSGLSGRLGGKLEGFVENPGDFCALELKLKIPVGSGVCILISFAGEIEKSDSDVLIKFNGQLGASAGIEKLFTVQATFGGYIEAKGRDATHALELMSLSFYKRAQGRLPGSWNDKIWGVGGKVLKQDGAEAEVWSAYVTQRMESGDYVESGLIAELGLEIGDSDKLGAAAKLTGVTGTRWSAEAAKDGDSKDKPKVALAKEGVNGGKLGLVLSAGAIGVQGNLSFDYKHVGKANEISISGSASLDKAYLGVVGGKLFDHIKSLLVVANGKMATRLAKDEDAKKQLKAAEEDGGFKQVFQSALSTEVGAIKDGAISAKRETAVGPAKTTDPVAYNDLQAVDDKYAEGQKAVVDKITGATSFTEGAEKKVFEAEKAVNDKAAELVPIKSSATGSIELGFDLSYSTADGWDVEIYLKESSGTKLDIGIATAKMDKGHKYSSKNNALALARKADDKAAAERARKRLAESASE